MGGRSTGKKAEVALVARRLWQLSWTEGVDISGKEAVIRALVEACPHLGKEEAINIVQQKCQGMLISLSLFLSEESVVHVMNSKLDLCVVMQRTK